MKGLVLLWILMAAIGVNAQTATYSTIDFPNVYANKITTCLFSANFRSGFIHQTNGSINMGLTGGKSVNFRFRWLAHDAGAIDYSSDIDQVMYLDGWGNLNVKNSIAIGGLNFDPTKYKLLVEGTIGARKLKITQLNPWPDYVFQADYPLPSLSYVERFVRNNKRLPDIPSQEEIMTDGLDVGEMNRLLMLKVEELTLYIIELNKKVEVLQALHQEKSR